MEKRPVEKCWAIFSKILWRITVLRGDKIIDPELGKEENVIAPVLSVKSGAI